MREIYDMNLSALRMYYTRRPTYKAENEVKNVVFRCDVVKDKDILDALKDVKHKSDYIKSLLRRGLEAEKGEKAESEAHAAEVGEDNDVQAKSVAEKF